MIVHPCDVVPSAELYDSLSYHAKPAVVWKFFTAREPNVGLRDKVLCCHMESVLYIVWNFIEVLKLTEFVTSVLAVRSSLILKFLTRPIHFSNNHSLWSSFLPLAACWSLPCWRSRVCINDVHLKCRFPISNLGTGFHDWCPSSYCSVCLCQYFPHGAPPSPAVPKIGNYGSGRSSIKTHSDNLCIIIININFT